MNKEIIRKLLYSPNVDDNRLAFGYLEDETFENMIEDYGFQESSMDTGRYLLYRESGKKPYAVYIDNKHYRVQFGRAAIILRKI